MPQLSAGFARGDVHPALDVTMAGYGGREETAKSVCDPLEARALVLRAGEQVCALVGTDLIGVDGGLVACVREQVAAVLPLPPENLTVWGTHTHWGPELRHESYYPSYLIEKISQPYREELITKLAEVVIGAWQDAKPAHVGWGSGFADGISFNRRPVDMTGATQMRLTLPPEQAQAAAHIGNTLASRWKHNEHKGPRLSAPAAEVEGLRCGVADAEVALLRLQQADGAPLAALAGFACHAVCGNGDFYAVSADYPGFARSAFMQITGAQMVFASGCSGDQVPRWRGEDSRRKVGTSLGAEAARTWIGIDSLHEDVELRCASTVAALPAACSESPEEARMALDAHADPDGNEASTARMDLMRARRVAERATIPAEIQAVAVGDFALVGLPGEVLNEIGLQIKQRSPFAVTMIVSLANDCLGYLPTDDAIAEGGYEPRWSPVGPGCERVLTDTALALLTQLHT